MKENFNYNKIKNEFTKEMLNDTLKYQKNMVLILVKITLPGIMKQMHLDIHICKAYLHKNMGDYLQQQYP